MLLVTWHFCKLGILHGIIIGTYFFYLHFGIILVSWYIMNNTKLRIIKHILGVYFLPVEI